MDMTIREAGAEGVYTAIADGMKAAAISRELAAEKDEKRLLEAANKALRDELARKDRIIAMLNKKCRDDRRERQDARESAWRNRMGDKKNILEVTVFILIGMVLSFTIISVILTRTMP